MSISNLQDLNLAIAKLEADKKLQGKELISEFHETVEKMKPINLIKSALGNVVPSHVISTVLKTAGSLGLGLITNKIVGGAAAASTGKKLIGNLIQHTATQAAVNNIDKIKAYGTAIYHTLFNGKKKD